MNHSLVGKHLNQLRNAGLDGLNQDAVKALNISLAYLHPNKVISLEAQNDNNNKSFLDRILEIIINGYRLFKIAIKKAIRDFINGFNKKYTEWEMTNVGFGETEPVEINVTSPYLFKGSECLLKSNSLYIKTDLVPNNNYRKFQFANGVSSLSVMGNTLIEQLDSGEELDANYLYDDLFDELSELIQPLPEDNYGNWGLVNYNKNIGTSRDFNTLKEIKFKAGGDNSGNYTLIVDNPQDCIASIKLIKEQLKFVEKIIDGYTYFDMKEAVLIKNKQQFSELLKTDQSDKVKEALEMFNLAYELFSKYAEINLKFMLSLAKSLTAAGDVYYKAYVQFRKQK